MSFDDFIGKWNDKGIDFDGYYGDQCMDLMHQYCVEVLGITDGNVLAAGYAKDVYLNFDNVSGHDKFDKIANTPTGVPNKGDIIFWGTGIGVAGHVAIWLDGNINNFRSFDQNFPTGSKCHLQSHTYAGVLGWLRVKPNQNIQQQLNQAIADRDKNWNLYQDALKQRDQIKAQLKQKLNDLSNSL